MARSLTLRSLKYQLLTLLEDKGLPVGTRRLWAGVEYIKQPNGTWAKISGKKKNAKPAPAPAAGHKPSAAPSAASVPGERMEIPTGRKWVDKVPGLPEHTLSHYTDHTGRLKPERARLHEEIVRKFTSSIPPVSEDKRPVAIVTMGAPASGKSSALDKVARGDMVRIDSDAIKEMLPEYIEGVEKSARNAAAAVHEESSRLSQKVFEAAIANRQNLIFDGTGKNRYGHIDTVRALKDNGYHVHLVMTDLDKEIGLHRAKVRAEQTGRWVPEEIITSAYDAVPKNFAAIAKYADDASIFDTRKIPPEVVFEKKNGKEEDRNPDFMRKFREKHGRD